MERLKYYHRAGNQIEAIEKEFIVLPASKNIIEVTADYIEVTNSFFYALMYQNSVNYTNGETMKTMEIDGITYAAKY